MAAYFEDAEAPRVIASLGVTRIRKHSGQECIVLGWDLVMLQLNAKEGFFFNHYYFLLLFFNYY